MCHFKFHSGALRIFRAIFRGYSNSCKLKAICANRLIVELHPTNHWYTPISLEDNHSYFLLFDFFLL